MDINDIILFINENKEEVRSILTSNFKPTSIIDDMSYLFIKWFNIKNKHDNIQIEKDLNWGWFKLQNFYYKFNISIGNKKIFSFKVPYQISTKTNNYKNIIIIMDKDANEIKHCKILKTTIDELNIKDKLLDSYNKNKQFPINKEDFDKLFNNKYIKDKLFNNTKNLKDSEVFNPMFYGNKYSNWIDENIDNTVLLESIYEIMYSFNVYDLLKSPQQIDEIINDYLDLCNENDIVNIKKFIIDVISPVVKGYYSECVLNDFLKHSYYKNSYKWNNEVDYFISKQRDYIDFSIFVDEKEILIDSKFDPNCRSIDLQFFGNCDKCDHIIFIYTGIN